MPRPLRRVLLFTATFLLIVVTLTAAAWYALPYYAPPVARAVLAERGIRLAELEIRRPTPGGLTVGTVRLASEDPALTLRLDGVQLGWRWSALRQGRLTAVSIARAEAILDAARPDPTPAQEPASLAVLAERLRQMASALADPDAAPVLPSELLPQLPVERFDLERSRLRIRLPEDAVVVTGSAHLAGGALTATGAVRGGPLRLLVDVNLDARVDDALSVRVAAPGAGEVATVSGTLAQRDGGIAFEGRAAVDPDAAARVLGPALPPGRLTLNGGVFVGPAAIRLALEPETVVAVVLTSDRGRLEVASRIDEPVVIALDDSGTLSAHGTLPASLEGSLDARPLDLTLQVEALGGTLRAPTATLALEGAIGTPDAAEHLRLALRGSIETLADGGRVAAGTALEVATASAAGFGVTDLRARLAEPARLELTEDGPRLAPTQLVLHPGGVVHAGRRLDLAGVEIALAPRFDGERLTSSIELVGEAGPRLTAGLHIRPATGALRLDLDQLTADLAPDELAARAVAWWAGDEMPWPLRAGTLTATGALRWPDPGGSRLDLALTDAAVAALGADAEGVAVHTALDVGEETLALEEVEFVLGRLELPDTLAPMPLVLTDVRVEGGARLPLAAVTEPAGADVRTELDARIGEITSPGLVVETVAVEAELEVTDGAPSSGIVTVGAERVETGVSLTDLGCRLRLTAPEQLRLQACGAALLGGRVAVPNGGLDLGTGDGYLPTAVTGIDLGELLALMQDPNLDGTGTLDGSLPLALEGWQPEMDAGRLAARPPGGRLRYDAAPGLIESAARSGLEIALRALEDFDYDELSADVDYATDGTLAVGASLKGRNPAVQQGRAIHFNLNVTQNLPTLLQSLRLSQNIGRGIERGLDRRTDTP